MHFIHLLFLCRCLLLLSISFQFACNCWAFDSGGKIPALFDVHLFSYVVHLLFSVLFLDMNSLVSVTWKFRKLFVNELVV